MVFASQFQALVTTALNFLILISIWKTPSLHKPSQILIGSLALSDLLVGAIGDPLMVINHIAGLRGWSLNVFCLVFKSSRSVVFALGAISLLTLTGISLDRLLALKLRNRYQSVVTQKRVLLFLVACGIFAFVITASLLGYLNLNSHNLAALLLFAGIVAFILLLTISVLYSMAFYSLRKFSFSSAVSPSDQNEEAVARPRSNIDLAKYRKSLITMFIVFILTIIFYTPFAFVYISSSVFKSSKMSMATYDIILICLDIAGFFSILNSAMNPILYLWRIQDIREAVKTTVRSFLKIF